MARVYLENVKKVFDDNFIAVDNANLDIADKEFMVIVGPSGCGKTTTLRMIAGLEEVSEGKISIGERVVNNVAPKDRDIAMVFQNYALYPHMSVFNNMAFGLKLRKVPKADIKRRVMQAANMLGIEEQLEKKPKALSGGQRQRVALGRAIVREPAAFLFDEPLSNLDAKLRVSTRAELKLLHQRLQTTSIYVTHDQAEAMTLGDRICVMYKGKIQQVDEPMAVYNRPVNRFVAGFLGTPLMNFFEVELHDNVLNLGQEKISISAEMLKKIKAYDGKKLVLGVRPECFSLSAIEGLSQNSIQGQVQVVEPLGDRIEVYLTNDQGERFVVICQPHEALRPNQTMQLYINTGKIHIFEPGETGKNLLY
ncbi:MAG: sn-glycerol-3-phosphate ABC transporter ATP-binding protein UgpC [Phycisphaerae bacterium]|nr:sn-glycerol-3-phosphate ABC transporter ATP-binding protein UgpC [Phycisphaerae bacterium]